MRRKRRDQARQPGSYNNILVMAHGESDKAGNRLQRLFYACGTWDGRTAGRMPHHQQYIRPLAAGSFKNLI